MATLNGVPVKANLVYSNGAIQGTIVINGAFLEDQLTYEGSVAGLPGVRKGYVTLKSRTTDMKTTEIYVLATVYDLVEIAKS